MKSRFDTFLQKNILALFILMLVWVISSPFILTHFSVVNLSNAGGIGSAIGGITAPAIGIFTALLLYITLNKQIESLKSSRQESNFKLVYNELTEFKKFIDEFQYKNAKGKDAILEWTAYIKVEVEQQRYYTELIKEIDRINVLTIFFQRILYLLKRFELDSSNYNFLTEELSFVYNNFFKEAHLGFYGINTNPALSDNQVFTRIVNEKQKWEDIKKGLNLI